jgi:four helix bundle protein
MNEFEHERLDVYRAAIQFLGLADTIAGNRPRGRSYLADQLRRAASSISFNIAEGAGEFALADKARCYRMARRSATESASVPWFTERDYSCPPPGTSSMLIKP